MRSPHRYINRLAHERGAVERLKLLLLLLLLLLLVLLLVVVIPLYAADEYARRWQRLPTCRVSLQCARIIVLWL